MIAEERETTITHAEADDVGGEVIAYTITGSLVFFEATELPGISIGPRKDTTRSFIKCPGCGRFSKYLTSYYARLGNYDEFRSVVMCSQCGKMEIY